MWGVGRKGGREGDREREKDFVFCWMNFTPDRSNLMYIGFQDDDNMSRI